MIHDSYALDLRAFALCEETNQALPLTTSWRYASDLDAIITNEEEKLSLHQTTRRSKNRGRAILTNEQAREIFRSKPTPVCRNRTQAGTLSKMYGISEKTIRDIWNGRTWYRATCNLDQTNPPALERLQKRAGRPKGAKDSNPRAKKFSKDRTSPDMTESTFLQLFTKIDCIKHDAEQSQTIAEHAKAEPQTADCVLDMPQRCILDPSMPIGPDFPGDLSSQRFQDPFEENWDGGLWEEEGTDPFSIFGPSEDWAIRAVLGNSWQIHGM
jgi:hypothetical protein